MYIKGAIDDETRCSHYHAENDRIAIKFYCCNTYYSCYKCHEQYGCGDTKLWPKAKFNQEAILCGNCKQELTINEYLHGGYSCPHCHVSFNPGCALHYHLYFEK
ncbi:CHY zinc finger protein [Virgibacillus siamensis]|uniref:CHY zinc finger protein n=1 Tax=Virgibacillus siamensis TaxID=480071 RepID=UPI0009869938|nr:CHY zinc finger protein [Virgibacillus siamensis]